MGWQLLEADDCLFFILKISWEKDFKAPWSHCYIFLIIFLLFTFILDHIHYILSHCHLVHTRPSIMCWYIYKLKFHPWRLWPFLEVESESVSLGRVQLFVILRTIACQASLSTGFSRQEYCSGLPFPSPRDLPDPGIKLRPPAFRVDSLPSKPPGTP